MSRFNTKNQGTKTTNLAGGDAYKTSPELELVSILLTSMLQDSSFELSSKQLTRLKILIDKVDPLFAAKASLFARDRFGLRSISHVVASLIAKRAKGQPWLKDYYYSIVKRPDDMLEILSHYRRHSKALPNSLRKGFASYLESIDDYQASKYKASGKKISLKTVVRLTHPKSTPTLEKLMADKLQAASTWETRLSASRGDYTKKEEAWTDLLSSNKLGYFALLRNLNNILEQAENVVDLACKKLTDPIAISKSKVLPFRFVTAYQAVLAKTSHDSLFATKRDKVLLALQKALDLCVAGVPPLKGKTVIALDVSGSMFSGWLPKPLSEEIKAKSPFVNAAIFAAALVKACPQSVIMLYDNNVSVLKITDPNISVMQLVNIMFDNAGRGGTDLGLVFDVLSKRKEAVDRVFILSDMQSWVSSSRLKFNAYLNHVGKRPKVYSMDFKAYGTLEFPEKDVVTLAGYSDKLFDLFEYTEQDPRALINYISNQVTFCRPSNSKFKSSSLSPQLAKQHLDKGLPQPDMDM